MTIEFCLVTHRMGAYIEDSDTDLDRKPDYAKISGRVQFTPNLPAGDAVKVYDEEGARSVPVGTITAEIVDGVLSHEGEPGVYLFAGGEAANPSTIAYTATYSGLTAGGNPVALRPARFEAVPGGVVDLADFQPIAGSPGVGVVQGPPGEDGADGVTPHIQDGTWWIGDIDTGVNAMPEAPGLVTTEINAQLPPKIDQLVPPKVAEALSTDQTIRDAATLAVNDAAETAVIGVADGAVTRPKLAPEVVQELESKADLVGGVIPTSQIPAVALTKPHQVTDRAALLALTDVQEGDVGVITGGPDRGTLMLGDGPPNVWESWVPLATSPDAPVQSVNGQTGTVVLGAGDVGAAPATHGHLTKDITDSRTWTGRPGDANAVVKTDPQGWFFVGADPSHSSHPTRKSYVDQEVAAVPRTHVLTAIEELNGLDAQIGDIIIIVAQSEGVTVMYFMEVISLPVSAESGYTMISYLTTAPAYHTHPRSQITNLPAISVTATNNALVQRTTVGQIALPPATPSANEAVRRDWVELQIAAAIADL